MLAVTAVAARPTRNGEARGSEAFSGLDAGGDRKNSFAELTAAFDRDAASSVSVQTDRCTSPPRMSRAPSRPLKADVYDERRKIPPRVRVVKLLQRLHYHVACRSHALPARDHRDGGS